MQGNRGLIREGILRDEVDTAEFGRIHPHFTGCSIHHPFKQIGGFRTTCPAIRINRRSRRGHAFNVGVNAWDLIAPGKQRCVQDCRCHDGKSRQVGADIGNAVDTQANYTVIRINPYLDLIDMVAAMCIRKKSL